MTHPYAGGGYLAALARPGEQACEVRAWGTSVLSRPIPEGGSDAVGAYPMAALAPDADVGRGLEQLAAAGLVSVVLVADPLRGPPADALARAFDVGRPFKTHYLAEPGRYAPGKHHRAEIRSSLKRCQVEIAAFDSVRAVWEALYAGLVERRAIAGAAVFGAAYWDWMSSLPQLVAFCARAEGEIVAMALWFEHEGVAYNHLGASSAAGYAAGAGYALYDAAIQHHQACGVANLGGGAGLSDDPNDGLARFKRGFAARTATGRLYGKVLDAERYAALSGGRETGFFPAYRG